MVPRPAIVSEMDVAFLAALRQNVNDFTRVCAERFDEVDRLLLDIAPQIHEGARPYFRKCRIMTMDLDPNSGADYIADLTRDNSSLIPADRFDFVLCTEVLEHTLQPFDAVREIHRMLKQGGLAFVSTPFNFRIHGPLPDCWRFTEHGLRALFGTFDILELKELATKNRDLMPIHYTMIVRKRSGDYGIK